MGGVPFSPIPHHLQFLHRFSLVSCPRSHLHKELSATDCDFMACLSRVVRVEKSSMPQIKAIGFDLFNTLIIPDSQALPEAMCRLIDNLQKNGFLLNQEGFEEAYHEAAVRFIEATRTDGRETHNRLWISAALETLGHALQPDDPRIAAAVTAYFSAFPEHCHLIPGTEEMLQALKGTYGLGLLSNFTHGPAARKIIGHLGLNPFFDVILISGEEGFRKPHPFVFRRLVQQLEAGPDQTLYVGDDPELDIMGAQGAGLHPVWATYVQNKEIPFSSTSPCDPPENHQSRVPRIASWEELFVLLRRLG
jgi:putative hydrolase of the HAD superfamily